MARVLLADDSPHAQRMGERILREEGYEVVTVTDGETATVRLADVNPDVILADVSLPGRSGYDICREVKNSPRYRPVRVVLTAGLLEHFDNEQALAARCDAMLRKPFEATAVLDLVKRLSEAAAADRAEMPASADEPGTLSSAIQGTARVADPESERVRAAVTLALHTAMPALIDELTGKVLLALRR
ncbi:MAG TPA: response regulator [Bryobacteraceae bacterium]|nr:response regulator [Bryobacteraceae bacterium]